MSAQELRYGLFSLAAAVLLWGVANSTSPIERAYDVPISTYGTPEGLALVDQDYKRINIRVRGSRAALSNLTVSDLVYSVNLGSAEPGAYRREVDITLLGDSLPQGADIVSRSPQSIVFILEPTRTREVPVKPLVSGEPPPGYRVGEVLVFPPRVTLTGARSQISRLAEIETEEVDVSNATEPLQSRVGLPAAQSRGWLSDPGLQVEVRVEISPARGGRRVP